jgi:hypothetical protein
MGQLLPDSNVWLQALLVAFPAQLRRCPSLPAVRQDLLALLSKEQPPAAGQQADDTLTL